MFKSEHNSVQRKKNDSVGGANSVITMSQTESGEEQITVQEEQIRCRVHCSPFAHQPFCTSCERQYSVSLRRAQWAHFAFGQEENSIKSGPKQPETGCFGPLLIEFSKEITTMCKRAGMNL